MPGRGGVTTDLIGKRGEDAASTELLRPVNSQVWFMPEFVGAKSGTLDFIVRLLDQKERPLGPFFFAQIKTTTNKRNVGSTALRVSFGAKHLVAAKKMRIPFYLIGVDATASNQERVFICGIGASRTQAISGIPLSRDLSSGAVKSTLYNEVTAFFSNSAFRHSTALRPAPRKRR